MIGRTVSHYLILDRIGGGLSRQTEERFPELLIANYVPRVKVPVIMVNGKYDHIFPLEASQKTLFQLLGTPAGKKEHSVLDTGHDMSANPKHIQAYLDFLDRTFGPTQ